MAGQSKVRVQGVLIKVFTIAVTSGAGTQTLDELLEGAVHKIKVSFSGVGGTPTTTIAEDGGMAQTLATFSGTTTQTRTPREVVEQPDGTDFTGQVCHFLLAQTRLKGTVASGSGSGTVTVIVYLVV